MRIDTSIRTGAVAKGGASRAASGVPFLLDESGAASRAAGPSTASAVHGLDSLLALQAVTNDPAERRRKAVRRGRTLLDTLDGLRADLLAGMIGTDRLGQLMAVIGTARERGDAALDPLLDEIELRARVELAKRGLFPGL